MVTAVILGAGQRGAEGYGKYALKKPELLKIVGLCDIAQDRLDKYKTIYNVEEENCFLSSDELFARGKIADVMFICTQDRDHYKHAITALKLGYHLLLEKPISPILAEVVEIARLAKELNRVVVVGHVLRYTAYFQKLKELVDSKIIGDIVGINQIENIESWHEAHSFVRGNWRNSNQTSPIVLQKTCHDMDTLYWLVNSKCKCVSSFGDLHLFKKEKAPAGHTLRCMDGCKAAANCPYDCRKIYLERFNNLTTSAEEKLITWPYCQVVVNATYDRLVSALKTGPYGRCVYECDNNVCDHQVVNMVFDNGVIGNLTLSAFTYLGGRQVKIMGTMGDIVADEVTRTISVGVYGKPMDVIDVNKLTNDFSGHGGGDNKLIQDFIDVINGVANHDCVTKIENSIESHIMSLSAEYSRLNGGIVVDCKDFYKDNSKIS